MANRRPPPRGTGVRITGKSLEEIHRSIQLLASTEVLVGVPESTNSRPDDPDEKVPINNATIGYIHEHGMPEQNIPARPWLAPGIRGARDRIAQALLRVARASLSGARPDQVEKMLHGVGIMAQSAVRMGIRAGIDPALADRTLQARAARGRKGAQAELDNRAKGVAPGTALAKPLIDTGSFIKSITYVLARRRRDRR